MHPCCHQCTNCFVGCQYGKHFPRRRMTLRRAVRKLQMTWALGGIPCRRCNRKYVEKLNHDKLCLYHPDKSVTVGHCAICKQFTRSALDCCGACPTCAEMMGGCTTSRHEPLYFDMLNSSGEVIRIMNNAD